MCLSLLPFLNGNVYCSSPVSHHCTLGVGGGKEERDNGLFNSQISRSRGALPTSKPDADHKMLDFERDAVTGLWESWEGVSIFHM